MSEIRHPRVIITLHRGRIVSIATDDPGCVDIYVVDYDRDAGPFSVEIPQGLLASKKAHAVRAEMANAPSWVEAAASAINKCHEVKLAVPLRRQLTRDSV